MFPKAAGQQTADFAVQPCAALRRPALDGRTWVPRGFRWGAVVKGDRMQYGIAALNRDLPIRCFLRRLPRFEDL